MKGPMSGRRGGRVVTAVALLAALITVPASPANAVDPPSPVTNPAATVSGGAVTVTWTDNATNEWTYDIYRSDYTPHVGWSRFGLVNVLGPDATSYTETPPGPGAYRYQARPYGEGGIARVNPTATAFVDFPPPAAPTNVVATYGPAGITVNWTDNSDEDYFTIFVRTRPRGTTTWSSLYGVIQKDRTTILASGPIDPLTTEISISLASSYYARSSPTVRAAVAQPPAPPNPELITGSCTAPGGPCVATVTLGGVRPPGSSIGLRYKTRPNATAPWSGWITVPMRFTGPTMTVPLPASGLYQFGAAVYAFDGLTPSVWRNTTVKRI